MLKSNLLAQLDKVELTAETLANGLLFKLNDLG